MDIWAPVVRNAADNTVANFTNDASTLSVTAIVAATFRVTATGTDTAAHDSCGNQWTDAYGELTLGNVPVASANLKWGVWLRVADSSNCYTVQADGGGTITISKVVAGTPTSLGTGSFTIGTITPGVFRAEAQGENIRAFWKGRHIVTVQDATYTGPGFVSLYMRVQSSGADVTAVRWEAGPLTTRYSSELVNTGSSRARRLG